MQLIKSADSIRFTIDRETNLGVGKEFNYDVKTGSQVKGFRAESLPDLRRKLVKAATEVLESVPEVKETTHKNQLSKLMTKGQQTTNESGNPVTRGFCRVDAEGWVYGLDAA
jgi:hypothetical protein